jgi:hypothetical protein
MSSDLESSLRQAATHLTLGLAPEDEETFQRLDTVRQWLREAPPPEAAGTYLLVLGRLGSAPAWRALPGHPLSIGRDPKAGLVLDSRHVSRRHCVLESDGTDCSVRDTGSTNGIRVNGVKRDLAWLVSGDILQVGDFRLFFLRVPGAGPRSPDGR